jgi:hypothetical protein
MLSDVVLRDRMLRAGEEERGGVALRSADRLIKLKPRIDRDGGVCRASWEAVCTVAGFSLLLTDLW